jgi:hypothetical protein
MPRFFAMPPPARPNSAAEVLGQYCNVEMAVKTLALVRPDTFAAPFTTRDTVATETPASRATSFTVHGLACISGCSLISVPSHVEENGPGFRSRELASLDSFALDSHPASGTRQEWRPSTFPALSTEAELNCLDAVELGFLSEPI